MILTEQTFGFRPGQHNSGYVRTVWLLRDVDVLAVLSPAVLPVSGKPMTVHRNGLLVDPGASVIRLGLPAKSGFFEETTETSQDGLAYLPALTVTLPRPGSDLDAYLAKNQLRRWVLFWVDGNGQGWVAGEPDNGMRLSLVRSQSDSNKLILGFRGRSLHALWRLDSTSLAELFPDADFDYSFDLSFTS